MGFEVKQKFGSWKWSSQVSPFFGEVVASLVFYISNVLLVIEIKLPSGILNIDIDPEHHHFLVQTSLPTPICQDHIDLLEGNFAMI